MRLEGYEPTIGEEEVAVSVGAIIALAVAGLVALGVVVYLAVGLFQARSLVRRELAAYFISPIAYVVMVIFLLVVGYQFYLTLVQLTATEYQLVLREPPDQKLNPALRQVPTSGLEGTEYPVQFLLGSRGGPLEQSMLGIKTFWLMFLFIPPLLTMRLFAEERGAGTLEVLMTSPLRDWQVVLSKYVACFVFYLLLWVPVLFFLPILLNPTWHTVWTTWTVLGLAGLGLLVLGGILLLPRLGTTARLVNLGVLLLGLILTGVGIGGHVTQDAEHVVTFNHDYVDPMPVMTTALGLVLAGAMFLALGMLISSLVRSQIVAAAIALLFGLVFIGAGFLPNLDPGGPVYQAVYYFTVPLHFERYFSRGVIDTRPLVLYSSVALFCLFLTVRSVESRRWL
jgi:ABC-2 type transport system permease protein